MLSCHIQLFPTPVKTHACLMQFRLAWFRCKVFLRDARWGKQTC